MITIKLTEDNNILWEIIVSGHANYESPEVAAICAAASMATVVTGNAIMYLNLKDFAHVEAEKGYFRIVIKDRNDIVDGLLSNLKHTLLELKDQYPNNIQITDLYRIAVPDGLKYEEWTPEKALGILGSIPLEIPSHPHLSMSEDKIEYVKKAYKVVDLALEELKVLKKLKTPKKVFIKNKEKDVEYSE